MEDLKEEAICWKCVGEPYLQKQIKADGEKRECRYCGKKARSYTLEEVADCVETAFDQHFQVTASEPDGYQWAMIKDPESTYDFEREGNPTAEAIEYAALLPTEAATDIQSILDDRHSDFESAAMGEETPFSADCHYEEITPGDDEWQEEWRSFEKSIKTEARFFSRTAASSLGALFDDIDEMRTADGKGLIVSAGPGTEIPLLFRARVFQSDAKLKKALEAPDKELAAPPSALAAAGRMNAKGISTFYGATTAEVALNEVRPPVGSQVAIAQFEIIRPLRLLDLNALAEVHVAGSIFDPAYARELGRKMFLSKLRDRITRPVMPDDQETEYLPTQAIADYLSTEGKVPLDGILFPSVQAGGDGLNVVLFHKASLCEAIERPKGTTVEATISRTGDDGWGPEYYVIEEVPPPEPEKKVQPGPFGRVLQIDWDELENGDYRDPTLRILPDRTEVRVVQSVQFKTTEHKVTTHQWEKGKSPF